MVRVGTWAREARGFTLVEATITIAIIAIAAAVVVPAMNNLTHANLRSSASQLSGLVHAAYDAAALSGQTHRMGLSFESRVIKVGATEQVLALEPGSNVLAAAAGAADDPASTAGGFMEAINAAADEAAAQASLTGGDDAEEEVPSLGAEFAGALFGMGKVGARAGMAGDDSFRDTGMELELGDGARVMDVWIQGMDEPSAEGIAYLYFFPNGYTQDALIHLEDDDGNVFTVKTEALTGSTAVVPGYIEAKR